MDELARDLADEARKLNLNALNVPHCPESVVRAFAGVVLDELAARGLPESAVVACRRAQWRWGAGRRLAAGNIEPGR